MLTMTKPRTTTRPITLARADLIRLLDQARQVAPARCPKPVLACVHLEASAGWLRLRVTDGELALFARTPADGCLPPCLVPCGELLRRLKASKNKACSLSLSDDDEQLIVNGGRVEHALVTLNVDDFPLVPCEYVGDVVTVDAGELCSASRIAGHAVAKEPSRYAVHGMLLDSNEEGVHLVATDNRRLVVVELPSAKTDFQGRVIVPPKFMRLVERLTGNDTTCLTLAVEQQTTDNGGELAARIFAAAEDWLLSGYACDGRFPIYRDVIPESSSKYVVDRQPLLDTLGEVSLTKEQDRAVVRVDLEPERITLSAEAAGLGSSQASLPAEFLGGGDSTIHTAFNAEFLLDAFNAIEGDRVVIDVGQNTYSCSRSVIGKAALLYAEHQPNTHWVLMPVNAGLEATRENLGSNYPEELDGE